MKRKRTRFAALMGLVAVVLLACWVGLLVYVRQTLPSPPLPNPNGYDDFIKAGQMITTTLDNLADFDQVQLRALVTTNREALKLLRVGLTRQCSVPTEATLTNPPAGLSHLAELKASAKLLAAEGRLAELENRPTDAIHSYLDCVRLGTEISRGGFMLNRLLGIACEAMGISPLVKLLPKLSCEQMRPLLAELEKANGNSITWKQVAKNERRFARAQVKIYSNPFSLVWLLWQTRKMDGRAQAKHDLTAAHLRLLTVELALRCYRCDQGNSPISLELLVPKYLQAVPTDPFGKGSLIYRPSGTNWILYSFGLNRIDDNGKPVTGKSDVSLKSPGDLLYDSQW